MSTVINFATGVPRITNKGLLVEEARTNKCTNTNISPSATTNVTFIDFGTGGSLALVAAPDALTAYGITGNVYRLISGTGSAEVRVAGATGNTNAHTVSALVVGDAGSIGFVGTRTAFAASAVAARPTHTGVPSDSAQTFSLLITSGKTVYFVFNQLEEGSFASSYIPVAGASATRAGDAANLGTAALPAEGTIILTYIVPPTAVGTAARTYGWVSSDAGNSRLSLRIGDSGLATTPAAICGDGTTLTTITGTSLTPGTTAKIAVSYSTLSAQFAMAVNGTDQTAVRQLAAAALSNDFKLGHGGIGSNSGNTYFPRFQIIPRFMTPAERIAATT